MKNQNNQLLNILLPNLKNPEAIQKNIKLDFNEIKKKILNRKEENTKLNKPNKNTSKSTKKFSKAELKNIIHYEIQFKSKSN